MSRHDLNRKKLHNIQDETKTMSTSEVADVKGPGELVEQAGVHPSSETRPKVDDDEMIKGTEMHDPDTNTGGPKNPIGPGSLLNEIRALQERLQYLEIQAAQQSVMSFSVGASKNGPHSTQKRATAAHDDESHANESTDHHQEDRESRKHIQQLTSGKEWVQDAEIQAQLTADQRKTLGRREKGDWHNLGETTTGIYHVQKNGDILDGSIYRVINSENWSQDHIVKQPDVFGDIWMRSDEAPEAGPQRGLRPPSALQPRYRRAPPATTRHSNQTSKLGPPTKWDQSDSEEWGSDSSTRSQDFRYFRARLRGDFEWELDRLTAQVERYKKHKERKAARKQAEQMKKDDDERIEEYKAHGPLMADADRKSTLAEKLGASKLNQLSWSVFQLTRRAPVDYNFVIDVLIEEPRVSSSPWAWDPLEEKSARLVKKSHVEKLSSEQSPGQPEQWTGQRRLPERIRIHSKYILDSLSAMYASPIWKSSESLTTPVMLRPFKLLSAYDKEIRELCAKLVENDNANQTELPSKTGPSALEGQPETKQPTDTTSPSSNEQPELPSSQSPALSEDEKKRQGDDLRCLRQLMDEYIGEKIGYLNSVSCSKIFFSDIWYIFQPGTTVISSDGKQAYRVVNVSSKRHKGADRWSLFRSPLPDDSDGSSDSKTRKDARSDARNDFTIKCVYVHFDGHHIGPVLRSFGVSEWDGEKDVTFLDVYPLRFHVLKGLTERYSLSTTQQPSKDVLELEVERGTKALQERLVQRGRVFVDTMSVKQMYYAGLAIRTRDEIESQVIVDFEEALAHESRRRWIPKVRRLVGIDWAPKDKDDKKCEAECCWQEDVIDDTDVDKKITERFIDSMMAEIKDSPHKLPSVVIFPRSLDDVKSQANPFTDDELMIMSYSVFGFVLRDRTWAELDLDYLSAVATRGHVADQNDDDLDEASQGAFGRLVLPSGHKKMVLSLISQHFRNKQSQESNDEQVDIVRGKGKGLIILLHGAPGVGKTTTAEGVAETFGKPLFQITCGDLGSNPKDVETALQTNFALANRWGCILLLDEADVFLAERRREDFNRNGLVAVFLRVLEYYAGILFLTTNRIGDFDEAFASRIHMSLHYPPLDETSTVEVFRLNLNLIKERLQERIHIEEDKIIIAAAKHWNKNKGARWNGRQIRNACQTALALAEFDAQPKGKKYDIKEKSTAKVYLKLTHLEIVSNAYLEFMEYLKEVHGADSEVRAKESGLRALDTLLSTVRAQYKDSGRSGSDGYNYRPSQNENPFQSYHLRSGSSGLQPNHPPYQPGPTTPLSPDPVQLAPQGGVYSPQRYQGSPGPSHRMTYNQAAYTSNQLPLEPRSGAGAQQQQYQEAHHQQPQQQQQQMQPASYSQGSQVYGGHVYGGQYQAQTPTHPASQYSTPQGQGIQYQAGGPGVPSIPAGPGSHGGQSPLPGHFETGRPGGE